MVSSRMRLVVELIVGVVVVASRVLLVAVMLLRVLQETLHIDALDVVG